MTTKAWDFNSTKMKQITFILFSFALLLSCNEGAKTGSKDKADKKEKKIAVAKIEDFDCATFFKKGDYSGLCFTDSALLSYHGSGCIFAFQTKGDKQEQDLKIQFTPKTSTSLAQMHFNLNKSNYKKGTITDLSNLGDAAFFDVHGTDLKSLSRSNKDLHVQYKNIAFVIYAEYQSNTKRPCFFEHEELIAFAEKIIEHF